MNRATAITLNVLALYGISLVLAVAFTGAVALIGLRLLCERQFAASEPETGRMSRFARLAIALVLLMTALNVLSTVLMCGFAACPDDPTSYRLL